jgi:BASS family bile acid:Na+ symporter
MDVTALAMQISVVAFMIASLGGVGLSVAPRDVLAPLTHGRFVLLTLAIGWLAGPAVALLLLWAIPLDQPYSTALLLLALAPCAPFAPAMMRMARGDPAYVAAFMVLTAVVTVVVMPIGVPLLVPGAAVSAWDLARPLLLFVLAPVLAGTAVCGLWPHAAARLEPVVTTIARIATLALLVLVTVMYGRGVLDAVGSHAILAQVVFVAVVTVVADLAGAALHAPQRGVLTVGMSTRNIGAALAPLAAIERDPRAVVMIAIAVPVTLAAAAITARVLARRATVPA